MNIPGTSCAEVAPVTSIGNQHGATFLRPDNNIVNDESVFAADEGHGEDEEDEEDLFAEATASGSLGNCILRDELQMDARRLKKDFSKFRPWKHPNDEPVDGRAESGGDQGAGLLLPA